MFHVGHPVVGSEPCQGHRAVGDCGCVKHGTSCHVVDATASSVASMPTPRRLPRSPRGQAIADGRRARHPRRCQLLDPLHRCAVRVRRGRRCLRDRRRRPPVPRLPRRVRRDPARPQRTRSSTTRSAAAMDGVDLTGLGVTELEVALAERIVEVIPSAEQMIATMSGSEATAQAIRLARAVTDRDLIVKFQGGFHGWHDAVARNVISAPDKAYGRDPLSQGHPRAGRRRHAHRRVQRPGLGRGAVRPVPRPHRRGHPRTDPAQRRRAAADHRSSSQGLRDAHRSSAARCSSSTR